MRRRRRGRLAEFAGEDPLQGMANLFDLGLVFALAFLVALMLESYRTGVPSVSGDAAADRGPSGKAALEVLRGERVRMQRFRATREDLGGEGQRLGTAYRLRTGELVYVPDGAGAREGMAGGDPDRGADSGR